MKPSLLKNNWSDIFVLKIKIIMKNLRLVTEIRFYNEVILVKLFIVKEDSYLTNGIHLCTLVNSRTRQNNLH